MEEKVHQATHSASLDDSMEVIKPVIKAKAADATAKYPIWAAIAFLAALWVTVGSSRGIRSCADARDNLHTNDRGKDRNDHADEKYYSSNALAC